MPSPSGPPLTVVPNVVPGLAVVTPAEAGAVESIGAIACGRVGYELTVPTAEQRRSLRQSWMKRIYPVFLDGKLLLTSVKVHYRIHAPKDKREAVERALEIHDSRCPVSESVRRGITIEWSGEILDE